MMTSSRTHTDCCNVESPWLTPKHANVLILFILSNKPTPRFGQVREKAKNMARTWDWVRAKPKLLSHGDHRASSCCFWRITIQQVVINVSVVPSSCQLFLDQTWRCVCWVWCCSLWRSWKHFEFKSVEDLRRNSTRTRNWSRSTAVKDWMGRGEQEGFHGPESIANPSRSTLSFIKQ